MAKEISHGWTTAQPDDPAHDVSADELNAHTETYSGLTAGHVLRASAATAADFAALEDADIPATIARDAEVTAAVAAEATLARNADNLTSGTVADARIAGTIARDSEVTSAVSTHAGDADAHHAEVHDHDADYEASGAVATHAAAGDPHAAYVQEAAVPGGELGGTYATPTVDATHSGSTHAATQAAAEATAATALSGHTGDATDAHDASAVSVLDTAANFTGSDVEAVLAELQDNIDGVSGVGAPTDADYLVGTANGSLSGEIVVGATPGGELGNTWASPTVDATHSGSTHAAAQAAAEATAAAALSGHASDTTAIHGITDTSALVTTTTFDDHSARHENGGADEISVAGLSGALADAQTPTAHAASHADGGTDELSVADLADYSTIELDLGWLRLVDDFGAVPGGGSAAANTTAINAAFAALVGSPARLYIDPGTYDHAGPLLYANIGKSRITGAGRGVSIFRQMTAGEPIFRNTAHDVFDVTWEHFGVSWDHVGEAADAAATASVFDFAGNGGLSVFYGWDIHNVAAGYGNRFLDLTGTGQVSFWGSTIEKLILLRMHKRGFRFVSPTGIGMPRITLRDITCINDPTVQTATEEFIEGDGAQIVLDGLDLEGWVDMVMRVDGGEPCTARGLHVENHKLKTDGIRIFTAGDNALRLSNLAITANQNIAAQTVRTAIVSAFTGSHVHIENADLTLDNTAGDTVDLFDIQSDTEGASYEDIRSNGSLAVIIPTADATKASYVTYGVNRYAQRQRSGTTAQQPTAANAGKGAVFFNETTGFLEVSDGTNWLTGQAAITAHLADTSDAHDASAISFTPAGTIAATDVQAAIEEVASEAGGGGTSTLFVDFADAGNVTTGETDIYAHTLAAGQLAANGDWLDLDYGGLTTFANTQELLFKLWFGGTAVYTFGQTGPDNNTGWSFIARIVRVSASVIRCRGEFVLTNTNPVTSVAGNQTLQRTAYQELTGLTLANTQVVKLTAQVPTTGTSDLFVAKLGRISYHAAP